MDALRGDALGAIEAVVGGERAGRIESAGLESIHRELGGRDLVTVAETFTARLRSRGAPFAARLIEGVLGRHALVFFEEGPRARIHVPFEHRPTQGDGVDRLVAGGLGVVAPHGPHRDGWFGLPTNSLDLWLALGRVQPGNGLSLFPDVRGRRLARDVHGRLAAGQRIGPPLDVALDPGDALIFDGEHLHASQLNRTEESRVVVSYRAVLGIPWYAMAPAFRFRYAGALGGPAAALLARLADLEWHVLRLLSGKGQPPLKVRTTA
jgi:hypothetical protein